MYRVNYVDNTYRNRESRIYFDKKINDIITLYNIECHNVLFVGNNIYDQAERYRIEHFMEVIALIENWGGLSIDIQNYSLIIKYLKYFDLIIFNRVYEYDNAKILIDEAKEHGIKVVFAIDDLVYDEKYLALFQEATGVDAKYQLPYTKEYKKLIALCDGLFTTNDYLAARMKRDLHKKVWVCQNFFNMKEQEASKEYLDQKLNMEIYEDMFMMGYFSGTSTHFCDFMEVSDEIAEFMEEHDNTLLKLVGYIEAPPKFDKFIRSNRVVRYPFMDCCKLQKEIAEVDVNLIPLKINDFTNAKSEIKYFDAALVGTISIMSPAYVYQKIVANGMIGYLCNKGEWKKTLELLYQKRRNLKADFEILSQQAVNQYSVSKQVKDVKKVFELMIK